ncbi:hypothetical protein SLEP1_g39536 [Rubroshorea leprosula]|uniref:Uncharacterized protein n=1 Tax=Rubroshorea leprosula TaxID=152421 RepID=A0AAV5L107_9ROSI|nr:hypothetical protein SLEP1_g39536 [Rubroshorea leprosula]
MDDLSHLIWVDSDSIFSTSTQHQICESLEKNKEGKELNSSEKEREGQWTMIRSGQDRTRRREWCSGARPRVRRTDGEKEITEIRSRREMI